MRLLVQCVETGRFLVPSPLGFEPEWVSSLREAGGGVMTDGERAVKLIHDYSEFDQSCIVVDLDRLGTENDYET